MQNVALWHCLSLKTEEPFALSGCGELRRARKQKTGRGSFLIFQLGPLHGPRRTRTAEEKWGGGGEEGVCVCVGGGGGGAGERRSGWLGGKESTAYVLIELSVVRSVVA